MSVIQLKPSQLAELLDGAFAVYEPVVIVGKPGVGKTAIVEQVARRRGMDFIKSHPALDDPTDGKGLPWFEKGKGASFVPIGQFAKVLAATKPTVWLLDDFLMAGDAVQKTYMQWLHGRECAGHVLPACVQIVIATNDRMHKAGAGGMLEPIKSRATIVELVEDFDEWATWLLAQTEIDGVALPPDLVAESIAFLKFKPTLFCAFEPNVDLKNSPNPRTWVKAIKWLTREMSPAVAVAALAGTVGEGAAIERVSFREMYRQLPTIDQILTDPAGVQIPKDKPSVLYAVARGAATQVTVKNFVNAATFALRLHDAGAGEFATLMMMDAAKRTPAITQLPEYGTMIITSPLGKMIAGRA